MKKITFIIDDIAFLKELYKEEITEDQFTNIASDMPSFKAHFTLIGNKYPDRYNLTTADGEKLNINDLNGYQRGCIIGDCYTYFEGMINYSFKGVKPFGVVEIIEER